MAANWIGEDKSQSHALDLGVGWGQKGVPLRTPAKDCLSPSWELCFTSKLARGPHPRYQAIWQIPRASVSPLPRTASSRAFLPGDYPKGTHVPTGRMENPGCRELPDLPSVTGPEPGASDFKPAPKCGTSPSGRRKAKMHLNLGAALGNLRPVILLPLWFQVDVFQRPLSL